MRFPSFVEVVTKATYPAQSDSEIVGLSAAGSSTDGVNGCSTILRSNFFRTNRALGSGSAISDMKKPGHLEHSEAFRFDFAAGPRSPVSAVQCGPTGDNSRWNGVALRCALVALMLAVSLLVLLGVASNGHRPAPCGSVSTEMSERDLSISPAVALPIANQPALVALASNKPTNGSEDLRERGKSNAVLGTLQPDKNATGSEGGLAQTTLRFDERYSDKVKETAHEQRI